jgi:hypothetical protein
MAEIITACILFVVAAAAFVLSFRSFRGKGFLLNNAYIYASKKERENMDKRPYYRQSAIVFGMIGLIFLLNGLSVLLAAKWITYAMVAVMIATAAYAIASGIAIEKKK